MTDRLRAPFQYYGGKGNMLAKILPLLPLGGRPYCEPYCGAASLFFARDQAPVEVLNDLNGWVVNFFRVMQNKDTFEELRHRLMWTPYARAEFIRALEIGNDANDVDLAWAFFVRQNMGMSGAGKTAGSWSRIFVSARGMSSATNRWIMRLSMLDAFRWRLMRAQIDNRDALEVIWYWDCPDAVFYCDPPYHRETRISKDVYDFEVDDEHHAALVEILLGCKGAVVLSGYSHEVYTPLEFAGWERIEFNTACHAAGRGRGSGLQGEGAALKKVPRTEVVWRNPKAVALAPRSERGIV